MLRWKKEARLTGLASVGAAPRGHILRDGDKELARVCPLGGGWSSPLRGWYWVCASDVFGEYVNTHKSPAPDEKTAKDQAMQFVKRKIAEARGE